MAQFPNLDRKLTNRGKSHTNLVISEGMAPAEEMIISRTNGAKSFIYEYGPEGNQTVVLAKGKAVEVVGSEYDTETGFYKTAVKQATDATENAIGVAHHNVYSRRRDGMVSTLTTPTVITRNYIEVPLFETEGATLAEAQVLAEAMKFGAAVSESAEAETLLLPGDRVVSDRSGNFRKYVKGTDAPEAIIGQVWAKETELPPAGFLQYYSDLVNPEMEAYLKMISRNPSPGKPASGEGAFPYGAPYTNKGWKPEFEKMLMGAKMQGIPFLTDGFFRAQEMRTFTVAKGTAGTMALDANNVEAVRTTDGTVFDVANNKVVVKAGVKNPALFIKLKQKLDVTKLANVEIQLGGKKVNADDFNIDIQNNTIVVYPAINDTKTDVELAGLTITAPLVVDPIAGIPTAWDHKGSVGAVRILLQK